MLAFGKMEAGYAEEQTRQWIAEQGTTDRHTGR